MVTNITADEVTYLAPYMNSFSFDATDFKMIKGKTQINDIYDEFIVDDDDLYKTIIETF